MCFKRILSKITQLSYQSLNKLTMKKILQSSMVGLLCFSSVSCSTGHDVCEIGSNSLSAFDVSGRIRHGQRCYIPIDIYFECFVFDIRDGAIDKMVVCSFNPEILQTELNRLNAAFAPINFEFVASRFLPVTHYLCFDNSDDFDKNWKESIVEHMSRDDDVFCSIMANVNRSVCSLFIQFGIGPNLSGLSKLPYWEDSKGIRICGPKMTDYLLCHEFGHYYGLLHTFHPGGDNISDTPDGPLDTSLVGTSSDPNSNNIMTYCFDGKEKIFTQGQYDMMQKFMISFRCEEMYSEIPNGCSNLGDVSKNITNIIHSLE